MAQAPPEPAGTTAPCAVRPALPAALAVAAVLLGAGCGNPQGGDYGGRHPDYGHALAGSPRPLAALHRQAGELGHGGPASFAHRISTLRGYPVVVNKWASWCEPCRKEFPLFQQAAARYGKRVAFLGVNSEDSDAAARTFLREYPVPYPSLSDPDQKIAEQMHATLGFPSTAFYTRSGKLRFVKQGQYSSQLQLEADIHLYGLGRKR